MLNRVKPVNPRERDEFPRLAPGGGFMRLAKMMALPVGAVLAVAAAGCGSSSNTSSSTTTSAAPTAAKTVEPMFVGTVAGTNAYIGMITSSQQIIAYVCDGAGHKTGDHFQGNVPPGVTSVTFTSPDSSDTLTVNAGQSQLQKAITSGGTVTGTWKEAVGTSHTFNAEAAHVPGALWTANDTASGTTRTGDWIVLNDGSVRGSADLSKSGQTTTLGQSSGPKGSNGTGQFTAANGNSGTTTTNGNSGTTTTNGNSGTTTTNGNSGTTTTNGLALGTVIRAPDGTVVGVIDQQFIDAQNKFLQDLATQPTPQPQLQAVLPTIQVNVQNPGFAFTQTALNIARVSCPFGGHIDPGFPGECVG
jgi:hypothetical protein